MCYLSKKDRVIFTSHDFGDLECPSLSERDRQAFLNTAKLAMVKQDSNEEETDEEELAQMYGYTGVDLKKNDEEEYSQVTKRNDSHNNTNHDHRMTNWKCSLIQPLPSQILTVY